MIRFLVIVVVAGLIYYVLNWGLMTVAPPEPFFKLAQVVLVLGVVVVICYALLELAGIDPRSGGKSGP